MPTSWDGAAFKDYELRSSVDGNTWKSVVQGQGTNQDCCDFQEISFAPVTARHFQLSLKSDWGYTYFALAYIECKARLLPPDP